MKTTKCALTCLIVIVIAFIATGAHAQTVKGRVDRLTPYGLYPAAQVRVTLLSPQMGRSADVYVTPEGLYYLYNVPPGSYVLEVWASEQPLTMPVQVLNLPVTELPPFTIQ